MTVSSTVLADLAGTELGTRTVNYSERDAILYALAVGARADELELVFERDLRVLPTFATALGLWAVEAAGDLGAYDRLTSLHASQRLRIHTPLPKAADLAMTARISSVWDKGKAAMVDIDVDCTMFSATYSIFLPGLGGWGGDRGPSGRREAPTGAERITEIRTSSTAAALYRLTGDLHPVHIDPEAAARSGFDRPILHGLCTLGMSTLAAARVLGAPPWTLSLLSARFAAPVFPAQSLRVSVVGDATDAAFTTEADGKAVLTDCAATFGRPTSDDQGDT